ncbi:sensor histidine kinase [Bacillus sp. FJAT-28004]|uniref:cache domain-containing sensor histidine kinase n=1 Tax=Bacillus sp. FJAT-28004 TaxID=1679165 RepID=UPI0006B69243|nr:sensor histidine kinase [Bacillus sp. FJAT-28004]
MKTVQSKLLIMFIVVTLLPVITMGTYAYWISVNAAKQNAGQAMQAALEQIGKNLDFQQRMYLKYMDYMVSSTDLKAIFYNSDFNRTTVQTWDVYRKLDIIMNGLFLREESVAAVALYKNNQLVYRFKGVQSNDLQGLGNTDLYETVMSHKGRVQMHTMQMINKDSGGKENYYIFGRRLYDNIDRHEEEAYNAGVFLFVPEKFFSDIFRMGNEQGENIVMISSLRGQILSHTDSEKIGSRLNFEGVTGLPEHTMNGSYPSVVNGKQVMIGYYRLPQWDMQVIQIIPQDVFIGKIRPIANSTVILSVLLFLVLLFLSWFIARKLSRPVRKLIVAMRQMQNGNFDIQIEPNFDYEFNILASSFNYMAVRLKESVARLIDEEKRRGEIELHMLQYQINPHFVNNTIGSIRLYALTQGAHQVAEVLHVLARLFQRTLGSSGQLIRVRSELANIKDYIRIHKMQYMGEMGFEVEINDEVTDVYMPNLLLQPLVENALFHGLNSAPADPILSIKVRKEGEELVISVCDNGVGMSKERIEEIMSGEDRLPDRLNKIGVQNVDKRLKLYYGPQYGVTLISIPSKGTEALVRLPCIYKEGGPSLEKSHYSGR